MHTTKHLRLASSQPAPKTYGEGYIAGYDDGHDRGRRDIRSEWLAIGFFAGAIFAAGVVLLVQWK